MRRQKNATNPKEDRNSFGDFGLGEFLTVLSCSVSGATTFLTHYVQVSHCYPPESDFLGWHFKLSPLSLPKAYRTLSVCCCIAELNETTPSRYTKHEVPFKLKSTPSMSIRNLLGAPNNTLPWGCIKKRPGVWKTWSFRLLFVCLNLIESTA
jgi:hypothetical protein